MKKYSLSSTISTVISGMGATFSRLQVDDPSFASNFGSSWMETTKIFGIQVDWLSYVFELIQNKFLSAVTEQSQNWKNQADGAAGVFIVLVILGASACAWLMVSKVEEMVWYSKGLLNLIPTAIILNNEELRKAIISQKGLEIVQ